VTTVLTMLGTKKLAVINLSKLKNITNFFGVSAARELLSFTHLLAALYYLQVPETRSAITFQVSTSEH
jgi:hypothetical protein